MGDWLAGTGLGYTSTPTSSALVEEDSGKFWVVTEIENDDESFTWLDPNGDGNDIIVKVGDWAYWNGIAWSKIANLISNAYTKTEVDDLVNLRVLQSVYDIFVNNTNNSLSSINTAFGGYIDKVILSNKGSIAVGTGTTEVINGISRPVITTVVPGSDTQLFTLENGMPVWKDAPSAEPIIVDISNIDNTDVTIFDMDGIGNETISMRIRAEEKVSNQPVFFELNIINDLGVIKHTVSSILGDILFDVDVDETTTKEVVLTNLSNNWGTVRYYIIKF